MNFKRIISIIILIFLYILAIKDTITLYYIPGAEFSSFVSHIPQSLIIYVVLIEAFFSISIFMVPISLIINSYKQSPPTKPPFNVVVGISGMFAVLIIINNYISGVSWYSLVLLAGGILFTMISSRLIQIGQEANPLPIKESQSIKEFEGLCVYIMELDPYRPPQSFGVGPYTWGMLRRLLFKQGQQHYFIQNNPEIHKKVQIELYPLIKKTIFSYSYNKSFTSSIASNQFLFRHMVNVMNRNMKKENDPYLRMVEFNLADSSIPIYYLFIFLLIGGMFLSVFSEDYHLNILYGILVILAAGFFGYLLLAGIATRRRNKYGEKYDKDIKKAVQEIIYYGTELIKEKNIDPSKFPMQLKHGDYEGLKYDKKDENGYTAYFISIKNDIS